MIRFAIPPSTLRTIGDALNEKSISWAYFGGYYNDAVALSNDAVKDGTAQHVNVEAPGEFKVSAADYVLKQL